MNGGTYAEAKKAGFEDNKAGFITRFGGDIRDGRIPGDSEEFIRAAVAWGFPHEQATFLYRFGIEIRVEAEECMQGYELERRKERLDKWYRLSGIFLKYAFIITASVVTGYFIGK